MAAEIKEMQTMIQAFCEQREWGQFHDPKDLAIGLITEASELLELFRFKNPEECLRVIQADLSRGHVEDELADVLFYILRFAQKYDIDLVSAFRQKMEKNAEKYPVEKCKGSNKKYNEL